MGELPSGQAACVYLVSELGKADQLTVTLNRRNVSFSLSGSEVLLFLDVVFERSREDRYMQLSPSREALGKDASNGQRTLKIGRLMIGISADELKAIQQQLARNHALVFGVCRCGIAPKTTDKRIKVQ